MLTGLEKDKALFLRDEVIKNIKESHLKQFESGKGNVFQISDFYAGVWLEHAYDAVAWVDYDNSDPKVSLNQIKLFLDCQKENGQLPFCVHSENGKLNAFYSQTQEVVSFSSVSLKALEQNNYMELDTVYSKLCGWDKWLVDNRFNENGMMMTFCGFDTGHDYSVRHSGFGKYEKRFFDDASVCPKDNEFLPEVMPDMNAIVYGNRIALSKMAKLLGKPKEAEIWEEKAKTIKSKIYEFCYDRKDDYFYDLDKNGVKRTFKTISLSSLFVEKVLDKKEGQRLFKKYFLSPEYFGTEFPYPSVAVCDKGFCKNNEGNSWNYYSQGLTMLRTLLWMDEYGLSSYLEQNMEVWVKALINNKDNPFAQELDPFTGKASKCSPYYSATMLYFLHALKRLNIK